MTAQIGAKEQDFDKKSMGAVRQTVKHTKTKCEERFSSHFVFSMRLEWPAPCSNPQKAGNFLPRQSSQILHEAYKKPSIWSIFETAVGRERPWPGEDCFVPVKKWYGNKLAFKKAVRKRPKTSNF